MNSRIIIKEFCQYAMFDIDGQKLRELIIKEWNQNKSPVVLDFSDIEFFATMFFNSSIGYLLIQYGEEKIRDGIIVENLSQLGKATYEHSLENAIEVRNNPAYRDALATYSEDE